MNTISIGADLITIACYVAVMVLFQPASRNVARAALGLSVLGCLVQATVCIIDLGSILFLRVLALANAFTGNDLQSVAAAFVRFHDRGFSVAILFFGIYCFAIGALSLRSGSMARVVGVLMACGGLANVISSLTTFLSMPATKVLAPYATFLGSIGEGALILWLLVIASHAWKEQRA